jgi:transposase
MEQPSLYAGIDVSKLKHDVAIVNEQKKLVHKMFVIDDTRDGYQMLHNKLSWLKQKHQIRQFFIGLEATSDYWKNIYYYLKQQSPDYQLTVINPFQTRAFAKAILRRAKTDAVNAKDIALFMVEKKPAPSIDRPRICENIKDVDTQIYHLTKQQTMTINKLRIELGKVAPEIERKFYTKSARQLFSLLENYPTAEAICQASVDQLRQIRYGKKQWLLPMNFVVNMKKLAENSIAHKTGNGAGVVIQSLVRRLIGLRQEIEFLNHQLTLLYKEISDNDSVLITINGIGTQTAIVLEAYIGDVNRFPTAKQIVAYFGMNPTVTFSGSSIRRSSRLEKRGNGIVRHKLFMATINIIRMKKGPIYKFYQRLVDSGKPKLVAIGAVMRKLLTIIYQMLKNNEKFDPDKV